MQASMVPPLLIAALVLILAVPYVRRFRHPESRPVAAYLIFVLAFLAGAAVLYGILTTLLFVFGVGHVLSTVRGAAVFLVLDLVPPLILAHYLIRRPPREAPMP